MLAFDSFNDEGIEKFRFFSNLNFQFFVLKSDFIIKRLIELSLVLLIFLNSVENRAWTRSILAALA